jgi:tRNA-dihydrouridine synthase B
VAIPVFGSGDCVEAEQLVSRAGNEHISGVLVGRGALRNPWIFSQAADLAAGRPAREVSLAERGQFLLAYMDLLLNEGDHETPGFRHSLPGARSDRDEREARGRERWVINKLRALGSWYTKGIDNGSHLRVAVNSATSIRQLRDQIQEFFFEDVARGQAGGSVMSAPSLAASAASSIS